METTGNYFLCKKIKFLILIKYIYKKILNEKMKTNLKTDKILNT